MNSLICSQHFARNWKIVERSSRLPTRCSERKGLLPINTTAMASHANNFPKEEAIYKDEKMYSLLAALRSIPAISGASCQTVKTSRESIEELRVR